MELKDINIGFTLTGSFCTFKKVIPKIKELKELGANILPIMSYNSYNLDTKFGNAKDFIEEIEGITENKIIHTIQGAEPIGPKGLTDIMVVAPCSAENIGKLLNRKNYYFVPFTQDNPITKPTSIVFKFDYLIPTIKGALENKQIQPVIG